MTKKLVYFGLIINLNSFLSAHKIEFRIAHTGRSYTIEQIDYQTTTNAQLITHVGDILGLPLSDFYLASNGTKIISNQDLIPDFSTKCAYLDVVCKRIIYEPKLLPKSIWAHYFKTGKIKIPTRKY